MTEMQSQPKIKEVQDKLELVRGNIAKLQASTDWDDDLAFKEKMITSYRKMLAKGEQWLLENKPQ